MARKQSSPKVSALAGRILSGKHPTRSEVNQLAASVLSQDEESIMKSPTKKPDAPKPVPEEQPAAPIIPENEGWGERQAREAREAEKRDGERGPKS